MTLRAFFGKFVELKAKVTPRPTKASPDAPTFEADLLGIYQQAGIPPAPFSAEQAISILSSLGDDLEGAKRSRLLAQTLAAITKNLNTSPEAVVEDATRKAAALSAAIERERKRFADLEASKAAEIKALERQRAEKAAAVQTARARERQLEDRYRAEAERLQELQKLLGADAARGDGR
jgi:hypothetical protein